MARQVNFEVYYVKKSHQIEVRAQAWDGEEEGEKEHKVIWSLDRVNPKVFSILGINLKTTPLIKLFLGNSDIRCFFTVDRDGLTYNTESSEGMGDDEWSSWSLLDDILVSGEEPSKEIEQIAVMLAAYIAASKKTIGEKKDALAKCKRLREIAKIVKEVE